MLGWTYMWHINNGKSQQSEKERMMVVFCVGIVTVAMVSFCSNIFGQLKIFTDPPPEPKVPPQTHKSKHGGLYYVSSLVINKMA